MTLKWFEETRMNIIEFDFGEPDMSNCDIDTNVAIYNKVTVKIGDQILDDFASEIVIVNDAWAEVYQDGVLCESGFAQEMCDKVGDSDQSMLEKFERALKKQGEEKLCIDWFHWFSFEMEKRALDNPTS